MEFVTETVVVQSVLLRDRRLGREMVCRKKVKFTAETRKEWLVRC